MRRVFVSAVLFLGSFQNHAAAADFPVALGIDGTWGRSLETGLGARLAVGLGSAKTWEAVGHFVYYLPSVKVDTEYHYYEANANLTRGIYAGEDAIRPFFGAGLNVARETQTVVQQGEDTTTLDETSAALNLLAGMHIGSGMRGLFAEARAVIGSDTQMVVTAGIRF